MPRKKPSQDQVTRVFVGVVPAFSGKLLLVDPSCLENFITESMEANGYSARGRHGFGYSGTCNVAKRGAGQILDNAAENIAVATVTPGKDDYPVYALMRGDKVLRLVVVFDADPCGEAPAKSRKAKRRKPKKW